MSKNKSFWFLLIIITFIVFFTKNSSSIIWPVDCPKDFPGDFSQQHIISGVLGEYRVDPPHFHGGVDIPGTIDDPVYSVLTGVVERVTTSSIGIRNEWDPTGERFDVYRYIHVYITNSASVGDSIVDDLTLIGWRYNSETGNWEWPRHLPIAYIGQHAVGAHLHFEDVYYNDKPGDDWPDGYYYKWNPLDENYGLKPFSDPNAPKFSTVDPIKFYSDDYSSPLPDHNGDYLDPYRVGDKFDVRIHAYDENKTGGGSYKLALDEIWYLIYDEWGDLVASWEPFNFWLLSKTSYSYSTVTQGIKFIYDTTISQNDDYYYWISNDYDNYKNYDGGKDTCIDPKSLLNPEVKYLFYIYLYDIKDNFTYDSVWIIYKTTKVEDEESLSAKPAEFFLSQNYPNPFNANTIIEFAIPKNSKVNLSIYNILGQKITTLLDEVKDPGFYKIIWNGNDQEGHVVATGVYFYKLQTDEFIESKKMILLR